MSDFTSEVLAFQSFMERLQKGDDAAARVLFREYAHRLIGLAQRRLEVTLRSRVDAEDVVQSVFKSFFRRCHEWNLDGWDHLWAVLARITLCKCHRQREKAHTARRDVGLEVSLGEEFLSQEPAPEEALLLTETVEEVLRRFPEADRVLVGQLLQEEPIAAIADAACCSQRKVYRIRERLGTILDDMCQQAVQ